MREAAQRRAEKAIDPCGLIRYISSVRGVGLRKVIRGLAARLKNALVQDCPPELYACEVCGQRQCSSARWMSCERRLAASEFMRTGNRQALAELKELYQEAGRTCVEPPPAAGPGGPGQEGVSAPAGPT